jgi:hypothetical protein
MGKKVRYSGVLNKPMSNPISLLKAALSRGEENLEKLHREEYIDRQKALYEHYGLSFDPALNGHALALKLAADHIKGFSLDQEKKAGRPAFWTGLGGLEFYIRVQTKLLEKENMSIRQALGIVEQSMSLEHGLDELNARYHERKDKNAQSLGMMKKAMQNIANKEGVSPMPDKAVLEMILSFVKEDRKDPKE